MREESHWSFHNSLNNGHNSNLVSVSKDSYGPLALATLSTAMLLYLLQDKNKKTIFTKHVEKSRSTTLPGFGILGDRVNEFIEIFLDALAIYVHNDRKWDCQRRLLCEANQRAADYGVFHTVLIYFTSLSVSFFLRDQRVSESMEAMKRGRQGQDCATNYPQCPFSL